MRRQDGYGEIHMSWLRENWRLAISALVVILVVAIVWAVFVGATPTRVLQTCGGYTPPGGTCGPLPLPSGG
jgi:hypothetical protein